jgi:hypothetical protein
MEHGLRHDAAPDHAKDGDPFRQKERSESVSLLGRV